MLKGYTISTSSKKASGSGKDPGLFIRIKSKLNFYVFLAICLLLISSLLSSIKKTKEIAEGIGKRRETLTELEKEEGRLRDEIERVTSEEYIESQLRNSLGLSRDGEVVVILPEPDVVRKFALKVPEENKVPPVPTWKKWLKLFI